MILLLVVAAVLFAFFFYLAHVPLSLAIALAVLAAIAALQSWYENSPNAVWGQLQQFKNFPGIVKIAIVAVAIFIPIFASEIAGF